MPGTEVELGPFTSGLYSRDPYGETTPDDALVDCNDVIIDQGLITTRDYLVYIWQPPGVAIQKITGPTDINVYLLGTYVKAVNQIEAFNNNILFYTIHHADGTKRVYKHELGGQQTQIQNLTTLLAGAAVDEVRDMVSFEKYVYFIGNNTAVHFRYNVDTAATAPMTYMPIGVKAIIFKSRMFIAQTAFQNGTRDRIYYSEPRTATSDYNSAAAWPSTNYFEVGNSAGDEITGLAVVNDTLLILKQKSIWVFDFQAVPGSDGSLQKLADVGPTNPEAYYQWNDDIFFAAIDGFYQLVNYQVVKISDPLFMYTGSGTVYMAKNENWIWFKYGADTIYIFNLTERIWSKLGGDLGTSFSRALVTRDTSGVEFIIWKDTASNRIGYYARTGSFDLSINGTLGTAPQVKIKTKFYTFGAETKWKRLFMTFIRGFLGATNPALNIFTARDSVATNNIVLTFANATTVPEAIKLRTPMRFKYLQLELVTIDVNPFKSFVVYVSDSDTQSTRANA